jgi:hypothetical protein
MLKPKTKSIIVTILQAERRRLEQNFESLTPEQMVETGVVGDWSIKDVLAHLADWEAHMPLWIGAAREGDPVAEIESGLNWKQFKAFNQRIYERHRDQSLSRVMDYFRETHREFMEMVETMPEEEMLAQGRYAFIGKGAVYDWLSAYAGHDRWAKSHIRNWLKLKRINYAIQ